ncbi:amidohydrolase family protein [Mycolicibacterium sp.]|uniref:amidohydrolase family protein n=1 Tax=Mycolicibacterium sp. TaxID=2320850 RepID=UPI0037C537FD
MRKQGWTDRLTRLAPGLIDVHTHAIDPDFPDLSQYEGTFPSVERLGPHSARILLGGQLYREVDERCWSTSARIRDMDAEGVGVQILSPIPVTLSHGEPAAGAIELARAQNEFLSAMVATAPDRFLAFGAVPMQAPEVAVDELIRCVNDLGFVGVEIGTRIGDSDLSDGRFRDFFRVASDLSAAVLIHPFDRASDPRIVSAGLTFGLGMPTDTAVAAAQLLKSRMLDEAPDARFILAHGGGSLPALLPRLDRGQLLAGNGEQTSMSTRARKLLCDSLTYDLASLELALTRFGHDHVMMGTDYPFAARETPAGSILADLSDDLRARVSRSNLCTLCASIRPGSNAQHAAKIRADRGAADSRHHTTGG